MENTRTKTMKVCVVLFTPYIFCQWIFGVYHFAGFDVRTGFSARRTKAAVANTFDEGASDDFVLCLAGEGCIGDGNVCEYDVEGGSQ